MRNPIRARRLPPRRHGRRGIRVLPLLVDAGARQPRAEVRADAHANRAGDGRRPRHLRRPRQHRPACRPITNACQLSVDYHLLYAVNDRILGRNDDAIEHYTAALAADHRPEIYFDRGITYLEEGKLDPATADIALAARFNPQYLENVDAGMRERVAAVNKAVPYNPPPR